MPKDPSKLCKLRTRTCVICKTVFQRHISPAEIRAGKGIICSRPCGRKYSSLANRRGEFRNCIKCGKSFYAKPSEDRRGYVRQYCKLSCKQNVGGKCISADGYYIVNTPHGQMKEHRWIMEQHLGRRLRSTEIVHHKDHNKLNNEIANLELTTRAEHNRIHFCHR